MAGLVEYGSSDEDSDVQDVIMNESLKPEEQKKDEPPNGTAKTPEPPTTKESFVGPMMPPDTTTHTSLPEPEPEPEPETDPDPDPELDLPPGSPYTATRSLLRDLTLPPVPNLNLPPSPPGSPPPALVAKVENFLKLKAQGVHYNAKLEGLSSMRNPALMDQLLGFVGVNQDAAYATTLPLDLYDPYGFPEWAYRSGMRELEERERKRREAERAATGKVEFVKGSEGLPASGPGGLSKKRRQE